jgi:hypothetical protein
MTSRERWTVYPLLFLALGLAVRAGTIAEGPVAALRCESVDAGVVTCRELVVVDADGTVLVQVGPLEGGGGGIILKDAAGIDSVAIGRLAESRDGAIQFFDAEGRPLRRPTLPPR